MRGLLVFFQFLCLSLLQPLSALRYNRTQAHSHAHSHANSGLRGRADRQDRASEDATPSEISVVRIPRGGSRGKAQPSQTVEEAPIPSLEERAQQILLGGAGAHKPNLLRIQALLDRKDAEMSEALAELRDLKEEIAASEQAAFTGTGLVPAVESAPSQQELVAEPAEVAQPADLEQPSESEQPAEPERGSNLEQAAPADNDAMEIRPVAVSEQSSSAAVDDPPARRHHRRKKKKHHHHHHHRSDHDRDDEPEPEPSLPVEPQQSGDVQAAPHLVVLRPAAAAAAAVEEAAVEKPFLQEEVDVKAIREARAARITAFKIHRAKYTGVETIGRLFVLLGISVMVALLYYALWETRPSGSDGQGGVDDTNLMMYGSRAATAEQKAMRQSISSQVEPQRSQSVEPSRSQPLGEPQLSFQRSPQKMAQRSQTADSQRLSVTSQSQEVEPIDVPSQQRRPRARTVSFQAGAEGVEKIAFDADEDLESQRRRSSASSSRAPPTETQEHQEDTSQSQKFSPAPASADLLEQEPEKAAAPASSPEPGEGAETKAQDVQGLEQEDATSARKRDMQRGLSFFSSVDQEDKGYITRDDLEKHRAASLTDPRVSMEIETLKTQLERERSARMDAEKMSAGRRPSVASMSQVRQLHRQRTDEIRTLVKQKSEVFISGAAVGIDLGTTFSRVAIWKGGQVEILRNGVGHPMTPSVVSHHSGQSRPLVGEMAKQYIEYDPASCVYDAKRLLGRNFSEPTVQADMKTWPFKIVKESSSLDKAMIEVNVNGQDRLYHPEQITAMVLTKMREIAESHLEGRIRDVVLTTPAYFNDAQRQATKDAGRIAGLNVRHIMNEPTATAIAYCMNMQERAKQSVMIFDMGGGTTDASVVSIEDGEICVKATRGDTHFGGIDFDNLLLNHCIADFERKFPKEAKGIRHDFRALLRLRAQVELAKETLSTQKAVTVEVDNIVKGTDYRCAVTRDFFNELTSDLLAKAINYVELCLQDADMSIFDIHELVLSGGSSRIPKLREMLHAYFNIVPWDNFVPEETVVFGATCQAAILTADANLSIRVRDVAPLSVGIEAAGGIMAKLIKRNTPIPVRVTETFTTNKDNQAGVTVQVYEGERPMARDNKSLGKFRLTGIAPAARGVPKIDVTFDVDEDGILQVEAKDQSTGHIDKITIKETRGGMSKADVDRLVDEAEARKEDDSFIDKVAARYYFDGLVVLIKNAITTEDAKSMSPEDKATIENVVRDAFAWLEKNTHAEKEAFEAKQDEIVELINPLFDKVGLATLEQ